MAKKPPGYQVVVDLPNGTMSGNGLLFHNRETADLTARNLADQKGRTVRVVQNRLSGAHGTRAVTLATFEPRAREEGQ